MMTRFLAAVLVVAGAAAPAQNLLADPGFESGLANWNSFNNAYGEAANPPAIVPHTGNGVAKLYGNWWGSFNVSGVFQQFPANPGDNFMMDCWSRHYSGDALTGVGAANPSDDNWVVMKMAFFDSGGMEIGGAERTILDGTFATDHWHDNAPVCGTAPAGTTSVQALILYLQPLFDGGAVLVDDCYFGSPSFSMTAVHDPVSFDITATMSCGEANAQFGRFFSLDPANGTAPGAGSFFGLFIDPATLAGQISDAQAMNPLHGGLNDGAGDNSFTLPGVVGLSGLQVWLMGIQLPAGGGYDTTNIAALTLL